MTPKPEPDALDYHVAAVERAVAGLMGMAGAGVLPQQKVRLKHACERLLALPVRTMKVLTGRNRGLSSAEASKYWQVHSSPDEE